MAEPAFLLDTNILVYLIGGRSEILRERVELHAPGALVTSSICVAEALVGLRKEDRALRALEKLLMVVQPQPFNLAAAEICPDLPFKRGRFDRLIAAQCLAAGLALVTNNEADFADVRGLKIENWTTE